MEKTRRRQLTISVAVVVVDVALVAVAGILNQLLAASFLAGLGVGVIVTLTIYNTITNVARARKK